MIRFILVVSGLILYLILTLPIVLVGLLIGVFNRKARDYMFLGMVKCVFKLFLFYTGMKLTVIGEELVPKDQAALFVCNHQSYFDILVTYSRRKRLTGYVAKKSLKKVPILNMWMSFLYCLFLDRDNMKEGLKTILLGVEYLKSGISVCIFPEGTRGDGKTMLPFKEGSLKMAEKAKCPIVPMALSGTHEVWEKQFPRMKPANVTLQYGEPIYIENLSKEDKKHLGAYTQAIIQDMLDKQNTN